MEPVDIHKKFPDDDHCLIVKGADYTIRKCWIGSRTFYAGVVYWTWKFDLAPERRSGNWPYTHWLPANTVTLPALFQSTPSPLTRTMEVCPVCGNKRCPHATDPALPCTGSNEPDQPGSRYTTPTPGDPES